MEGILKYQECDLELQQLEKKLSNSNEKMVMNQMINFVKDAQNKSMELEKSAKKLTDDYTLLKQEYDKNFNAIKKLTAKSSTDLTEEQMQENFNQINQISSNLYMIERNLNIAVNNIKTVLKDFENTKKQVIMARTKHKESKDKYESLLNDINPKIEKIKKDMLAIEPKIKAELLNKYKSVKKDNIFPVFVELNNGNCGGCRMAQPKGKLDKLKADGFIICEQCGRVIYTEKQ